MHKSWVMSLQCIYVWCIWVAMHVQRRCCCSVYMSKDCIMSLQCMWLQCMYIDLIKRKIDRFTASCKHVNVQKLSRAFAITVWMSYISCSVCAKMLLLFCVYEQRLCHVFVMYVIAMYVNQSDKAKNRLIYCIMQTCKCAKAESCLRNICVNVVYKFNVESSAVIALCVVAMCVNWSKNGKNWLICYIMQVCKCTKAESCLRNICVCDVYELNVWIKRCYCSVCDCAACKSIWKCEKSISLLHHVCLYICKSWIMSSQYICICCIWVAACMQRRCCSFVYMQASTRWWLRCYCLAFWLCVSSTCE